MFYPLVEGPCWGFVVDDPAPPNTLPGSLLISVPLEVSAAQVGKLLVVQLADGLVMGWLKEKQEGSWLLQTGQGPLTLETTTITRLFVVERVDWAMST